MNGVARDGEGGGDASPAAVVAGLDRAATRAETPCGDGRMIWRSWGSGIGFAGP